MGTRRDHTCPSGRGTRRPQASSIRARRSTAGFPTGKTHFLEALGQAAVDAGHKVSWFSLEHLGALARPHNADDSVAKAIRRIGDMIAYNGGRPLRCLA